MFVRGDPGILFRVIEFAADLKSDDAAFRRHFFQQPVRHVSGDVIDAAQAVVRGDDGTIADVDRLGSCFVGGMRHVDHHAQPVHFANDIATMRGKATPFGW